MNKLTAWAATLLLAGAASAATLHAQDDDRGKRPPRPHGPPPLAAALDTNKDGTIDADEIANASASLATLDKNGDGELTRDELRPPGGPKGGCRKGKNGPPPEGAPDDAAE